jgi:uncharacterized protein Usg
MSDRSMLLGWRLTTAQIFYHLPDHPALIQEFIWQELDRAPQFPVLTRFLDHWEQNLDGKLHSVIVAVRGIISPTDLKHIGKEFKLN